MKSLSFLLSQTPQMGWQKDMFAPPRLSVGGGNLPPLPSPPPLPPPLAQIYVVNNTVAKRTACYHISGGVSSATFEQIARCQLMACFQMKECINLVG